MNFFFIKYRLYQEIYLTVIVQQAQDEKVAPMGVLHRLEVSLESI